MNFSSEGIAWIDDQAEERRYYIAALKG